MSHTVVAPSDGIKTKIIVSAALTASAVDERMDAGLRDDVDHNDDVIGVACGEGAVGERRGQRVRRHRDGRGSDAEIEYAIGGHGEGPLPDRTIICPLPIVECSCPCTISLGTLSAMGAHLGLAQFALCGEHRSHF